MQTTIIIFIALLVVGIMLLVNGIMLKGKNQIPKWMLKDVQITASSDVKGFSDYMWLKTIVASFVSFGYAAYYLISQLVEEIEYNSYVPITYVAMFMAFMIIMNGAKDKFLKNS